MSGLTERWQATFRMVEKLSPEEQDRLADYVIEDVEYGLEDEAGESELRAWLDELSRREEAALLSPTDRDPVAS